MKIAGFASQGVIESFYREFRKNEASELKNQFAVEAKAAIEQIRAKKQLTPWENKVRRRFASAGIDFETKARIFPLVGTEGKEYIFVPDFTLKNYLNNGRRILVEANEELSDHDMPMYAAFMRDHSSRYYLVMVVTDNQLRLWNTAGETMFHEIWTVDDTDYLTKDLMKYKVTAKPGYSVSKKDSPKTLKPTGPSKRHYCVGCGREFSTSDVSQIYCNICLSKLGLN